MGTFLNYQQLGEKLSCLVTDPQTTVKIPAHQNNIYIQSLTLPFWVSKFDNLSNVFLVMNGKRRILLSVSTWK